MSTADIPPRQPDRSRDHIDTVEVDVVPMDDDDFPSLSAGATPMRPVPAPSISVPVERRPTADAVETTSFGVTSGDSNNRASKPTFLGDDTMANNIKDILSGLQSIDGFIAAAVADSDSGMALGTIGGGAAFNVDMAAAANTEVVKAKGRAMKALKLNDAIEDILITLGTQYHIIRPLSSRPTVFFYIAVDRDKANLALARFALADAESELKLS